MPLVVWGGEALVATKIRAALTIVVIVRIQSFTEPGLVND